MPDVVTGAEPTSRRTRVLLVAVVVLVLLAAAADAWAATRERDRLLDAVVAGEQVVGGSQASVASLAQYVGGSLYGADVPPQVRRSAYDVLAQDARRWSPRVAAAQQQVAGTPVLPWHADLRAAREEYALRLQVWADRLAGFAADPQDGFPEEQGAPGTSRDRARATLLEAGIAADRLPALLG